MELSITNRELEDIMETYIVDKLGDGKEGYKILRYRRTGEDLNDLDKIFKGEYEWSTPTKVQIPKDNGKSRVVYIYNSKDRYLLTILNYMMSVQLEYLVSDNVYSYKPNTTTLNAIHDILSKGDIFSQYGLKVDISDYFNSVSKEYLLTIIEDLYGNNRGLKKSMKDLLLKDKYIYKGKTYNGYLSLIPGTPISSYLSNYALREVDRIAESKSITYVRYSDDLLLFAEDSDYLLEIYGQIKANLHNMGLEVNPSKEQYYNPGDKIEYLGYDLYLDEQGKKRIDLRDKKTKRIKREISNLAKSIRKNYTRKNVSNKTTTKKFFKEVNKLLYGVGHNGNLKYSWGYYNFNSINTDKTLKEIDKHIESRARYVYTGKNNNYSKGLLSRTRMKQWGYYPTTPLFHILKVDKDFYLYKVKQIREEIR